MARRRRRRTDQPITNFNQAVHTAQHAPGHRLNGIHPNTITALARRGLAVPTSDGTGWRLTDAGIAFQPQERT